MNSVNFFAEPYPGELWYSVVTRNFFYSGLCFQGTYLTDCYGFVKRNFSLVLPTALGAYLERNPCIDKKDIVENHSAYPFFAPFLREKNHKALAEKKNYRIRDVIPKNLVSLQKTLRYCPVCSKNDLQKYGEPFLHTIHHLPGIDFCPLDGHKLKDIILPMDVDPREKLVTLNEENFDLEKTEQISGEAEMKVLAMVRQLFTNAYNNYTVDDVRVRLQSLLGNKNTQNWLNWDQTYDLLAEKFDSNFIRTAGIEDVFTLKRLKLNQSTAIKPALGIILISLFFDDFNEFFSYQPDLKKEKSRKQTHLISKTESDGPVLLETEFSCPNPFCENHNRKNLEIYSFNPRVKKHVVRCDNCGMIMLVGGKDNIKIVQYGNLWLDNILRKYSEGLSYKEMATACNITHDIAYQKTHLPNPKPFPINDMVLKNREKLESLKEQGFTVPEIKKLAKSAVSSLRIYDKEWFETFLIKNQNRKYQIQDSGYVQVIGDDEGALEELKQIYTKLKNQYPPVRISTSLLSRNSKILNGSLSKKKYPESVSFIEKHTETIKDYYKRKARMVINHLIDSGKPVTRKNLIKECEWNFRKQGYGREEFEEYLKEIGLDDIL